MTVLLHRPGRRNSLAAREAARRLAAALGAEVTVSSGAAGDGAWTFLSGAEIIERKHPRDRLVVLLRRDPRWSLEDLAHRPLDRLPKGARIVVASELAAALLRRARADLEPVRAGSFPVPEETPVLAEGPFDGRPAGEPLDPVAFVPAPGTGLEALLAPGDSTVPPEVRAIEDADARVLATIERGFVEGMGELPDGCALGVLARKKVSVLYTVRAVLFRPGAAPREIVADIPQENAGVFARGFGRHLGT